MIGALLNASFGSLTELILFTLAIRKGALNDLILYSLTGGLLNDMLLIPGMFVVVAEICDHCSYCERLAADAERESISLSLLFDVCNACDIWFNVNIVCGSAYRVFTENSN